MKNQELALSLWSLAYKDYIASRVLLNKNYPIQGLTLASSSIEKYFKVILALHGNTKKNMGVHMDNWGKLKGLLTECYTDISIHLDNRFLELLGKIYQARYYDNLASPLMISFFINQVICEMDFTVNFMEQIMTMTDGNGNIVKSAYKRNVEKKNADLLDNNYLFLNISKKEFMEQPDNGYGVFIDNINGFKEFEVIGKDIKNQYNGFINDITLNFK
ncbi:hypothetical protein [Mucilaginibacter sp. R-33]|uniref:hypothetical protein n=1 Tax=unclassified Mucilaginibacter TaxID=2617802 RepID=UPI003CF1A090